MGLSSKDSTIYFMLPTCPIKLDGSAPEGFLNDRLQFSEEVTRIEINPAVYQRKYGHDKSFGAQDVCSGIKNWDGSITTKIAKTGQCATLSAGDIAFISVYPLGLNCTKPIQGYLSIDSDPLIMNLENGDPVEHNYRYSSKGMWTGFVNSGMQWGGFECGCSSGAAASVPGSAGPWAVEAAHTPVTAYQWNGSVWVQVYDEAEGKFLTGPMPQTPGTYQGQLEFVPCVAD